MSETLEERIRNTAKEDPNLGTVNAYATDLVELLEDRDARIRELEAALAGQHETVCAYCRQVFKREDHDAILEHIQTCEKRPEKLILEAWEREAKELKYRIALLYDAAMEVVDKHQEEGEFEAIKALAILLLKGPNDGTLEEPEA